MVWFWQLRGRMMGGVFVIMAPPGEGKSFIATAWALELMREGVKVYSNYPILSVDGQYCSYVFSRELMKENLNGCAIFIDEGYTMFNSRKYMEFSDEDHTWFATSGHNEMMIFIIAQNAARIDKVIREVLNLLYLVQKVRIPILDLPLWFRVDSLLDVDDIRDYRRGFIDAYTTERIRFSVDVALAYDTKFFRKTVKEPHQGTTWIEEYKKYDLEFAPRQLNIIQKIKFRGGMRITWLVTTFEMKRDQGLDQVFEWTDTISERLLTRLWIMNPKAQQLRDWMNRQKDLINKSRIMEYVDYLKNRHPRK